jgi:hypothetical protein
MTPPVPTATPTSERALDLDVPPTLLAIADEVIQRRQIALYFCYGSLLLKKSPTVRRCAIIESGRWNSWIVAHP